MKNFLDKRAKPIYFVFGILLFAVLLSALVFMSQYRFIRINYQFENGVAVFGEKMQMNGQNQTPLYKFFTRSDVLAGALPGGLVGGDFTLTYAQTVYDFRVRLDSYNNLIVIFAVVSLVCFAGLLILANHSRKVYYKSNLIGGIILPSVVGIFAIVMIILNVGLMSTFNENYDLFNIVSVLQNPENSTVYRPTRELSETLSRYDCNVTTFVIYMIVFILVLLYSLFLIAYSYYRYASSSEKRKSIIEKAGSVQC